MVVCQSIPALFYLYNMETKTEEIEIPVPWGHISAVSSGSFGGEVILFLHGIFDNAASFDLLLPLLPKGFFYVAIDLLGHGRSSHIPSGVPLDIMHFVYSVKLVVDYYKLNKIILIGHSFGGQIATLFASIYQEYCKKLILIDGFSGNLLRNKDIVRYFRRNFDETLSLNRLGSSKKQASYSYEELLSKTMKNRYNPLSREAAEALLKRTIIKSNNGYRFNLDNRLKTFVRVCFDEKHFQTFVNQIKCPCLLIATTDSLKHRHEFYDDFGTKYRGGISLKELSFILELPNFTVRIVHGKHDVHMNNAPLIAKLIVEFLLFNKSSL